MYRPQKLRMYEPTSPEYSLADTMLQERITAYSPEVYYWSFVRDDESIAPDFGSKERDELDIVYGEKSSANGKMAYLGPYEVKLALELDPIMAEMTRLGWQQIESVNAFGSVAAMDHYLKQRLPKSGDIFRVSWILTETERRFVFYKISNVTPVDPFNFRYLTWAIHAEQTTLHDAPDNIKQYSFSE
jgi:hypothetical protein